jgi:hypothetical protein
MCKFADGYSLSQRERARVRESVRNF